MRIRTSVCLCVALSAVFGSTADAGMRLRIEVSAGKHSRHNTPLVTGTPLPAKDIDGSVVVMTDAAGQPVPAQLAPCRLLNSKSVYAELHWVLKDLGAGQKTHFNVRIAERTGATKTPSAVFSWKDTPGRHADILWAGRPVVRYMYKAYENDPAKRDLDNKPFHHVFDPAGGRLVTKGTGGLYTHHQGLYYGFTKCSWDGGGCNTWYCHEGEHELHKELLAQEQGPVMARHRTAIDWNDRQGKAFCREQRELTVLAVAGGTLIEWSSRLRSVRGTVTLDGDAQHAGFQFRADDEVARRQDEKQTYFVRPDGTGEPGTTRNPVKGKGPDFPANKPMVNMPWHVMSFVLGTHRYSAIYLDTPRNPKPSFSAERSYGRFGGWFGKRTLVEGQGTIDLVYRVWVQRGEADADLASRLSSDFAAPPTVTVRRQAEDATSEQQNRPKKKRPARKSPFAPITDDPTLPRVLLIGDSISIGYTLPLREKLKGQANVHRPNTNCGPTTRGLEHLDSWLGEQPWDLIHFNWGLHDLKYIGPDGKSLADPNKAGSRQQVPVKAYEANLRRLVQRLKKTGAILVWRNTTPVPQGAKGRVPRDEVKYNEAALRVMREHNIPTDDMYAFALENLQKIQRPANVHFTQAGSQALAAHSGPIILKALDPRTGLRAMVARLSVLLAKKDYVKAIEMSLLPRDREKILKQTTIEQLAERFGQRKAGQLVAALKATQGVKPQLSQDGRVATFPLKPAVGTKSNIVFEKAGRFWCLRN